MIVVGTGGHAIEVLQILTENGTAAECVFYDDAEIGEPFRRLRVARSPAGAQGGGPGGRRAGGVTKVSLGSQQTARSCRGCGSALAPSSGPARSSPPPCRPT